MGGKIHGIRYASLRILWRRCMTGDGQELMAWILAVGLVLLLVRVLYDPRGKK
tara:strand:- start:354 stop:512 length:159 start_codon:yes stop_codon:yes gene_type:complete